uniref:Beta-microseminoprotein n=1 Tax=Cebus imitator TaxID=2715852 RepID=A0A2K5S2D6_CEBIM
MNVLLGRLVILATFVTLCNASCYLIPNKIVPGESTKIAIPVGYDKDNCQKIFKQEDCKYIVVEKKDPNKTCDVTEWIS